MDALNTLLIYPPTFRLGVHDWYVQCQNHNDDTRGDIIKPGYCTLVRLGIYPRLVSQRDDNLIAQFWDLSEN